MNNFKTVTDLHEYILYFCFAESSSFGLNISFEILLTVLQKKVQIFGSFGWFIEFDDIWAFKFHEYLNLSSDDFLIFDVFEGDGFDGE
jgi:hypothetical protein